jgi:hypothetical protein
MKRSSKPQTRPYHFTGSEEFFRQIDDWRRQEPDLPSRAESIRRLVALGLAVPRKPLPKNR